MRDSILESPSRNLLCDRNGVRFARMFYAYYSVICQHYLIKILIQALTFHIFGFGRQYRSVLKDVERRRFNGLELFMTLMQALATLRKLPPLLF